MRLKRLELQGFKSFVDRTIVHFESRITGVVGPNGCGKSNIVDAILWVMGEQSAKHLRGESMTDVIFNGAENRAPTSMAEVSLVLDKQGVMLAPQFGELDKTDEISITRRIYRDGQGEYLINKTMCRLKDIHELFMDTGVGRRAYSIIEQGQIDRMINVKPEERRHLFEEVAGITKYKAKKKEAEKKLESTGQNLLRLQDITGELEKQMRSLKIQATRARKYKEIKSELETVDLHLLGRQIYDLDKVLKELASRKNTCIEERSALEASEAQLLAQRTEADVCRIDLEVKSQEGSQKERSLAIDLEKLEGHLAICGQRKLFIESNTKNLSREREELNARLSILRSELATLTFDFEAYTCDLVAKKEQVLSLENQSTEASKEFSNYVEQKASLDSQLRELTQNHNRLESQIYYATEKEVELKALQVQLFDKLSFVTVERDSSAQALVEIDQKIEKVFSRFVELENEVSAIGENCKATSLIISEVEDELFESRALFQKRESRRQSLEELSQNLEGYIPTAREIRNKIPSSSAKPLAELIQPDSHIEAHVEHILGSDINTLITENLTEARELAAVIQDSGLERVGILSKEGISGVSHDENPQRIPGADPILSHVRVTAGYEAIAWRFLGNAYVARDRESFFEMRSQNPGAVIVTQDARLVAHRDGSMTCGLSNHSTGIFARRREIESLLSECAQLKDHNDSLGAKHADLLSQLEIQEAEREELKNKFSSVHIEKVELRKEKEKIQIEFSRADEDFQDVLRDTESAKKQLGAVRTSLEEWSHQDENLKRELAVSESKMAENSSAIDSARSRMEVATKDLEVKRVEIQSLVERVNALEFQQNKTKMEVDRGEGRSRSIDEQVEKDQLELNSIMEEAVRIQQGKETKGFERGKVAEMLHSLKTQFDSISEEIQTLKEAADEVLRKLQTVSSDIQVVELEYQQGESNRSIVQSLSNERYHHEATPISPFIIIPLERVPLFAEQLSTDWLSMEGSDRERLLDEHLSNLKSKIERYGEVNLTAIQEFDEIEGRFQFLSKQKEDLDRAVAVLQEAIIKIDETTKVRFEETFHVVNAKFKEIFPILFNGGKAELSLTVPTGGNVNDPGIDVMVQPPGKRLQSMSLLSGGEKALTAVSLILSIFARKPSPFCLLDEVDAPLDDANVSRFNTVIRKMSQKTQFIVITHNKKTMEMAESLYGVTMERAGVSKMTSVRLS